MPKRIHQHPEVQTVTLLGAIISLGFASPSLAQPDRLALEPMLVRSAQPDNPVRHDVKVKSVLDASRREVLLNGPTYHSVATAPKQEARFNWYTIAKPQAEPAREVTTCPENGGKDTMKVRLGKAVYFLATATILAEGKPPPAPDHLSHFVAYQIDRVEADASPAEVVFSSGTSTTKVRPTKAVLLCLPAEEWHHGDHSLIHDPGFCFLIYETKPSGSAHASPIGTLDQFGLNSLKLSLAKLVGVPARLVKGGDENTSPPGS